MKQEFELTHVKHEPAHCLAPVLFRSLTKGERKKEKLEVFYDFGDGNRIEFVGPYPLGADDLRVLQGLIAFAAPKGKLLEPEPATAKGYELRELLEMKYEAIRENARAVEITAHALMKEIGYETSGKNRYKHILDCIKRLFTVTAFVRKGKHEWGFHLLSYTEANENRGKFWVAINPFLATAITGGQHVHIDMAEIRALKSDPTRLIHQRLCGWIDQGKSGKIELDTLCSYIWPKEASEDTHRKRRTKTRKALEELTALGWKVTEYAKGKYEIKRPKAT